MELRIERAGTLYLAERERFYTLNAYLKFIEKAVKKEGEEDAPQEYKKCIRQYER